MLCERCKIREASIQYMEVINGVRTEHHFCTQCAKEMDFGAYSAIFDGDFPLAKLISGLLGGEEPEEKDGKFQQVVCPTCGMTYEEFVENSCFGCADCYSVFDLLIRDNIKQLQGSECHKGKHPKIHAHHAKAGNDAVMAVKDQAQEALYKDSAQEEIRGLERKLKMAVAEEDYETAAECRDKIRALREGTRTDA